MAIGAIELALVCDIEFDMFVYVKPSLEVSDVLRLHDIASRDASVLDGSLQKYPPHQCYHPERVISLRCFSFLLWNINVQRMG